MPMFTSGKVAATPFFIENGPQGLDLIRQALMQLPPNETALTPGWLGASNDDRIRQYGIAPGHEIPVQHISADPRTPDRLLARYYFWTHDPARAAILSHRPTHEHFRLDAMDVVITLLETGQILALASSRTPEHLSAVESGLAASLSGAVARFDQPTMLHLGRPDFFLWAIEWIENGPSIGEVSLLEGSSLATLDGFSRGSTIHHTVDSSRPVVLNAIANGETLGPMRLHVRIDSLPAKIAVELHLDGSFVVLTSETHYSIHAGVANKSMRAVEDVAFFLIPLLRSQYESDIDWSDSRRDSYIAKARQRLVDLYSGPDGT